MLFPPNTKVLRDFGQSRVSPRMVEINFTMTRRMPPMNALRAFEATARLGTLAKAARELCVTPSAVGHQVRALEEWFGTTLYEGAGNARRLTSAGERLARELGASFDQINDACRKLTKSNRATELHVNVTPTFAIRWLVPRLGRFQAQHPDITLHIGVGFHGVDFKRGEADVGLRFGWPDWPGLASHLVFEEDVFPVCSPKLVAGPKPLRHPDDLRNHTLLHTIHRRNDWGRWLEAAGLDGTTVDPSGGLNFELTTMAIDAAEAGLGVAITREMQVLDVLASGRLVAPFRRDLLRGEGCYFLSLPERSSEPAIVAFREWLLGEAASIGDPARISASAQSMDTRRTGRLQA